MQEELIKDEKIVQLLIKSGFTKMYPKPNTIRADELNYNDNHHTRTKDYSIDFDLWDYGLKINEINFLYYSFNYGRFSIAIKNGKGTAGGGYDEFTSILLPRLCRTIENVIKTINFFLK